MRKDKEWKKEAMDKFKEWDRFYEQTERHWNPDTAFSRYQKQRGVAPKRQPKPLSAKEQRKARLREKEAESLRQWARSEALKSLARTVGGPEMVAPTVSAPSRTNR